MFVLLIGESGVGKTTIADYMEQNYGLHQVVSYTNRSKRFDGEVGHHFIQERDIEKIKQEYPNRVAETEYNGNFYFATQEQIEECDIYVINPSAVEEFKRRYTGNKTVKVVLLIDTPENKVKHMLTRGDSIAKINERLNYDRDEFRNARDLADYVIANTGVEKTARIIRGAIWGWNVIAANQTKSKD